MSQRKQIAGALFSASALHALNHCRSGASKDFGELKHAARNGLPLGLLFVDLDRFKDVNDELGHAAGDQLLKQVAARITGRVRDTDTVARLGGDECTVILTDVTGPAYVKDISSLLIEELRRPFPLDAGQTAISASIGIAVYPRDGSTAEELVRQLHEVVERIELRLTA